MNKNLRMFFYFVVGGVLVAISLPNHSATSNHERSKDSSVKGNMHTFQTMLETYAVDWGGQYPINVSALKKEAEIKNYWKPFKNPFNPNISSFADLKVKKVDSFASGIEGIVYYEAIKNKDKSVTKYYVYGVGKNSSFLEDKGVILSLTNN